MDGSRGVRGDRVAEPARIWNWNSPISGGDAGERIAEFAEKFAADRVVLGSPAIELAEGNLHTSTVLQVIPKVACPVLCVPAAKSVALVKAIPAREPEFA